MVFFNYALRKLNAKIVYYGPGLCGKTTNLQWIHDHFEGGQRGKMLSLATEGDRTIFFDLLPLDIGTIRGMQVTLQLYTVPGQVHYNSTRQLVLRGADGVVFVADSQRTMSRSNIESFKNLEENLLLQGVELRSFPCVLQFNKRDLRDIMGVDEMDQMLNRFAVPFFEAIATNGVGVQDTLEGIVKLVMRSLRERYEPVAAAGPRSIELPSAPPRPVVKPPTLRVPSPPVAAPHAALEPPRGAAASAEPHDPRAVTLDLQAATRPPGIAEASPAVAPPSRGEERPPSGGEAQSLDDVPTAVFEAPELLEEPLLGSEPSFLDLHSEELHDEVTATVLDADEEVFLPGDVEVEVVPPPGEEGAIEFELDDEQEEPGDLLWGDAGVAPVEAPAAGEAAEPVSDSVFRPEPEVSEAREVVPDLAVGELVLDRERVESEPYEDHVRAPGPFAEVPLDRGEPFGEAAAGELTAAPEPSPFDRVLSEEPAWGLEAIPFDAAVEEEPPVEPGVSSLDLAGRARPSASPLWRSIRRSRRPPSYDERITSPLGEKPSPLHDEMTPSAPLPTADAPSGGQPAPEPRRDEPVPQRPLTSERRWEPTLPAAASVDDLVASVMPGRSRRAAPPAVSAEARPAVAPAAPPPPTPPVVVPRSVKRLPVQLDEGDPFAMDEEPRLVDERTPAAVEVARVVPSVELVPRTGEVQVRTGENQLRLQLQGSGAIAEYGEVREMDIVVPVPGPWIGNRRVTLQLRLTLTPAAEDVDDGTGDPS